MGAHSRAPAASERAAAQRAKRRAAGARSTSVDADACSVGGREVRYEPANARVDMFTCMRTTFVSSACSRLAAGMRGTVVFQALLLPRLLHRAHSRSSRPWNHRAAVAHADAALSDAVTYTPVGMYEGPFRRRNGTPRQGSLAPRARGTVRLLDDVLAGGASAALEGLAGFSHCVLLFAFHENQASRAAAKGALCRIAASLLLSTSHALALSRSGAAAAGRRSVRCLRHAQPAPAKPGGPERGAGGGSRVLLPPCLWL